MDVWVQNLIFALVGAVLAILGGVAIEHVRQQIAQRRLAFSLKQLLLVELEFLGNLLPQIIENRKSLGSFLLQYIIEVTAIRGGFDRNRDNIAVLFPEDIRRDILSFYHKLFVACTQVNGAEGMALTHMSDADAMLFVGKRRDDLLTEFQSLETKISPLRNALKNWEP